MNPDGIQNLPFVDCSVPLEGSLEDLRSKLAQEEQFIQQQRETEEAVLRRCFLLETVLQNMHQNGTTVDKMGGDTTFTTDEDASSMHVLLPWGDAVVQAKMNTRGLTEECRSLYATLSAQLRGGEGSSAPPAEGQTVDSVVILNSEERGQEEDGDEEAEQHYFEHLAYVPPSMPLPSVTELPSGPSPPPGEVTNLVTPPATQTEKTDSPPCTPSPVRRELEEYFPKHEKRPRRESELERHMSRVTSHDNVGGGPADAGDILEALAKIQPVKEHKPARKPQAGRTGRTAAQREQREREAQEERDRQGYVGVARKTGPPRDLSMTPPVDQTPSQYWDISFGNTRHPQ